MKTGARVIAADVAVRGAPLFSGVVSEERRRRITLEELEGRRTAEAILQRARAEASALVDRACADAKEIARDAACRGEAEARAQEAARWVLLRKEDAARLETDEERLVAVAVAMAERLLGASLELDPQRIVTLARAVLVEARGARRAIIEAHPLDARALREHLGTLGLDSPALEVRDASGLARGDLLLHTDVGTIDARIALRLERLAAALRDALIE
jgi:type III secretion protein L